MPTEIVVPELGESIIEATVTRWLKKEGDRVAIGDVLLELETEKVNLEVGSEHNGVLRKIMRQAGDDVRVGDVLGVIEEAGAAAEAPKPEAKRAAEAPKPKPAPQPTKQEPAKVEAAAPKPPAAEKPPTAAQPEPKAPPMQEGEQLPPESLEHFVVEEEHSVRAPQPAPSAQAQQGPPAKEPAREAEPERVRLNRELESSRHKAEPAPAAMEPAKGEPGKAVERVRMSRRRRTIARNLVAAQQTAAILTTFNEVDMLQVMELRKRLKESFQSRHGVGLGITSFFVKAVVGALKDFPVFNAEIQEDEIVYKKYFDIGVAIDTAEGLVVPVLRDADRMSFAAIEEGIKHYIDRAAEGELSLEDLKGGCFTITNGGVFGSLMSTPILNLPQVGILGLHKIEERPIAVKGQVVIHPMMYVALSYDHRLIDGRQAVQFLSRIKALIEDPGALLLEA